jgi:hypothetical protein
LQRSQIMGRWGARASVLLNSHGASPWGGYGAPVNPAARLRKASIQYKSECELAV